MSTLVCFAVRQEARFFKPNTSAPPRILITGMGPQNAVNAVLQAFQTSTPDAVITCGFAGGLDPALASGSVVWDGDESSSFFSLLLSSGARRVRFHCQSTIATTAREKARLRAEAGADGVEMESGAIRELCRQKRVPCVIVRVILDTAETDLPLDFNQLVDSRHHMNYFKLAGALIQKPSRIAALMEFNRSVHEASKALGAFLGGLFQAGG